MAQIEGIGIGLVGVAGPTCVSIWFPESTRGRALGIWATWVPVGCVLSFGIVPYISQALGFVAVFWMTAIISIVAFVLFALVFKMPPAHGQAGSPEAAQEEQMPSVRESFGFLKNKWIWMLGLVFFCFTFNTLGIVNSYYNTYLTLGGWDAAKASNITSICTGVGIITAPLAGVIFDKLKREHKRYLVAFVMFIIMVSVFFMWTSAGVGNPETGAIMTGMSWFSLVMFVGLQSICGGMGGGSMRPFAPMLVQQNAVAASMAMAVLQFMQNLGSGLGAVIYGALIDMTDISTWALPGNLLQLPICVIAIIIVCCINPWKKKGTDK
ncbi:MAG: MFS transporter [Coriobacteriales bacterium]